ncbi:hypothetical protein [Methylobacterium sp. E-005]|nr:hypothetical protein [Methylobacterium sp. E-005]
MSHRLNRLLTFGYRLAALPSEGEMRPSPRAWGEGFSTLVRAVAA